MDIREVRSFLALAGQSHFGRTARLLNLSQPALTKQIRRLEEDLGGPLLVRGRHGAQLTSVGRLFQAKALDVVRDWDDLLAHTRRVARGEAGRLRLGFGMHTFELVPRAIVRFRKSLPDVDVSVRDMSTFEQIEALHAEKIDLGFIRLGPVKKLSTLPLTQDRMMLVTSQAAGYSVTDDLSAVRHEPFVLISRQRSPTFHRHALNLCSKYGFLPRIVQEVPEVTTVLALVRAGLGVSVIPESFGHLFGVRRKPGSRIRDPFEPGSTQTEQGPTPAIENDGINRFQGIRAHHLTHKAAAWTAAAAWRKDDPNPLIQRFLALLKTELVSHGA